VSSVLEIKRYPSGTTANIQDGTAGTLDRMPLVDGPLVVLLKIWQSAADIDETVFTFNDFVSAMAFVAIPDLLPVRVARGCDGVTDVRLF
jgi:hypothetical protein